MLGGVVDMGGFVSTSSFRCQVPTELRRGCMVVYSSQDWRWSEPRFAPHINDSFGSNVSLNLMPGAVVADALFLFSTANAVLKFDLAAREMAVVRLPVTGYRWPTVLITTEDGGLGFAGTKDGTLYLWSRVAGPNEEARWTQSRVIELDRILPVSALPCSYIMQGSFGAIFLHTNDRIFSVDLKSNQARKMPKGFDVLNYVVPFMSFYTPALGAAFTDEEPASASSV